MKRSTAEEAMDAPDLDPATYAAVLRDLTQVNRITLAARPTLDFLDRVSANRDHIRILDVGYGAGDMLRRIARWAVARRKSVDLVGIDLNPNSAAVAKSLSGDKPIRYLTGDYADLSGQGWDVILSSLVAHHMTRPQLIAFLRFMEVEAAAGWFVNDLHRHRLAHLGYPLLARLMRWHPIVRADGRLSIARAFRPIEWRELLDEARIGAARIHRHFPLRLCVERLR